MKKYLALVMAVGMISSFTLSGSVSGMDGFADNSEGTRFAYIGRMYEDGLKESKGKGSEEKKNKKSKSSKASRLFKGVVYNGLTTAAALCVTNKIGYTENGNIKKNWNNLVGIVRQSNGVKDFARNLLANPDAVNTLSTAYNTVPACVTLGGIAGSVGSFVLGASNFSTPAGIAIGILLALGATGRSFMSTAIIPVASKMAGLLPDGGASGN